MTRYLLISISLHTALFAILVSFISWYPSNLILDAPIINIYTSSNTNSRPTSNISSKLAVKKNNTSIKTQTHQTQKQIEQLKIIIHDIIQSRLKYPSNVRIPIKPEIAVASLVIFPDGHIEKARIIKSSGLAIFDRTILETISTLPPIEETHLFVKKPTPLDIPVEFMKLTQTS